MAAAWALGDEPLTALLSEEVVPYETDEITRLILDPHDVDAFAPISHLTVGGLRDWLLETAASLDPSLTLAAVSPGLTPEMVAGVSGLMRNSDLVAVAAATQVQTGLRTTIGAPGRLATGLQPNHPTDDPAGIAAATLDGLLMGCGDAVIGINPATDSPRATARLLHLLDDVRQRFEDHFCGKLRRPDLGRQPATLEDTTPGGHDVAVVLADGLSPRDLATHGVEMLAALAEVLGPRYAIAPLVIATQARVALGDHIGTALGVSTMVVVIGERPGLSVSDSLGLYLTHEPRPGRTDNDRNCISNIHLRDGLGYAAAARTAAALIAGARELGASGVRLKDAGLPALGGIAD